MTKLLVITGSYLPGVKAGGPIRSISNLVEAIGDELEVFIITSDRDLGDHQPYEKIVDGANEIGKAKVYYMKPNFFSIIFTLIKIYNLVKPDVIYLNSFFNLRFTIIPLILRKFGFFKDSKIVIAPRGEFGSGALSLKSTKKKIFIRASKAVDLYANLNWHATSNTEVKNIHNIISEKNIIILPNIPLSVKKVIYIPVENLLKIVFVGRISKMKNLLFCLEILLSDFKEIDSTKKIVFDIYGPIEDLSYWKKCQDFINLNIYNSNIEILYKGTLLGSEVQETIANYDLLFLPTLGENYGQVIAEALSVGTSILISNQTPWKELEINNLGWDIPLNDKNKFYKVINLNLKHNASLKLAKRQNIIRWAEANLINKNTIEEYLNLLGKSE